MSRLILLLLIIGVLYIALTYLKGPRNSNTNTDSLTTHLFGGEAGYDGLLKVEDVTGEKTDFSEEEDYVAEENIEQAASMLPDAYTSPDSGIQIDPEVHVDADMISESGITGTPEQNPEK